MLIPIDQLKNSGQRFKESNTAATGAAPEAPRGNILGSNENLQKRKEMLQTLGQEPVDFAFERAIGKNDSLYSNFVELIERAKQKVGRIAIKSGSANTGFATGFLVSESLILTNWHVFPSLEEVADSEIQFFYEYDVAGNPGTPVSFRLDGNTFYYSNKDLDYCLVAVSPMDLSGTRPLRELGYIFLDPSLGKIGNENEEALNIIHHPDGDYKQLSIRENLFVKITPVSIWYRTDTAPGSSGSPVFNDQWQAVALHHMGVAKKNDAGDYVDKDGKVIPPVDGKVDAARVVWLANEGIRISVILNDLFARYPDHELINQIKINPGVKKYSLAPSATTASSENQKAANMETSNPSGEVQITFPASLLDTSGSISIQINQGSSAVARPAANGTVNNAGSDELSEDEIKKLETSTDYSACKGYQSGFLGKGLDIPLPQPLPALKKFVARLSGSDATVLKYYNYSTIFHSVRMMPLLSAINVVGDPAHRLDQAVRKDVWLRDTRLSLDIQLSDAYYKNSGFDKGHMSRREDADWGATAEEAKRNADLTCMFTNACPQVPGINQSQKKGLWGGLEKVVLEKGAELQKGNTGRISVFNGPVFQEKDPVFRGIQVPMDFFKIVLWLTDAGKLKATAFRLSQLNNVGDINFEELDLDQNTAYQEYQCSISSLQNDTHIDFSAISSYDTFEGKDNKKKALHSATEVAKHISKHNKK